MLTELGGKCDIDSSPARVPVDVEVCPLKPTDRSPRAVAHPATPPRTTITLKSVISPEQKILRGLCGRSPGVGSPKQQIRATAHQQLGAALML